MDQGLSMMERLVRLSADDRDRLMLGMTPSERLQLLTDWRFVARPSQLAPEGDWGVWLILAGRGSGKTRAGAEWVSAMARVCPGARIALVAATAHDALSVMIEGDSGIMAVAPAWDRPLYRGSRREVRWPNGSVANLFSAMEPNSLRGPQFNFAWCDEIAAWAKPKPAWDNLKMALRLGERPRMVVTTTPRPIALLRTLLGTPGIAVTRGSTYENRANLPAAFLADLTAGYSGTALGRQEVMGELLEKFEGALWSRDGLDQVRLKTAPELVRVVVGVDPPAGPGGCGIVAAGLDAKGVAHVLADASVRDASPDRWAAAVAAAATRFEADRVVVEVNNGGLMVESVLRAASLKLPLKSVRASRGKSARAEPVAALYSNGRVRHAGVFPELEDEMCGLLAGGGYVGPGESPDRADALVWALTELMLEGLAARPGVRAIV